VHSSLTELNCSLQQFDS